MVTACDMHGRKNRALAHIVLYTGVLRNDHVKNYPGLTLGSGCMKFELTDSQRHLVNGVSYYSLEGFAA